MIAREIAIESTQAPFVGADLDLPALAGLAAYLRYYNEERGHQALDYRTPTVVYETGQGGGACIRDRFASEDRADTSMPDSTRPEPGTPVQTATT